MKFEYREKKFYISNKQVFNPITEENVPKWKLEESPRIDGNRYYIHYFSPKKNDYEIIAVHFHFSYGTAHFSYLSENHPERIQELLDNGNIYLYISRLDRKVIRAVESQVRKWKETDTDYLLAQRNEDFLAINGLNANMIARAEEVVFPAIVYA